MWTVEMVKFEIKSNLIKYYIRMNGKNLIRCDVRAWNMVESMSR